MIRFIAWGISAFFLASLFSLAFLGIPFWAPIPNTGEGAFRTFALLTLHIVGFLAGLLYEALKNDH